jgi:hypothetical protein
MSRARDFADLAGSADAGGITGRNLIINGAMQVAQRGTTALTGNSVAGFACDRFEFYQGGDADVTLSQSTDAPSGSGFANSLKFDVVSADTSLGSSEIYVMRQKFEGQNIQSMKKGTSSAEAVTAQFWIKTSKTGTYILELVDNDNSRVISKAYTVSSANTWEHKTITFEGDTSGTITADNSRSIDFQWWIAAGSDYTSGTLSTTWTANTAANRAVGQVNALDNASNEIYITGVQLEIGEQATPFEHEPFETTEKKCFRYFQRRSNSSGYSIMASGGHWVNATTPKIPVFFHPRMRAAPTFSSAGSRHYVYGAGSLAAETGTPTLSDNTTGWSGLINGTTASVGTTGDHTRIQTNNGAGNIDFDAEL